MKVGDRVLHDFLGSGKIIDMMDDIVFLVKVKWDNRPPVQYNMGENPTVILPNELTVKK